jgi:Ca-activated chloride channel family protein
LSPLRGTRRKIAFGARWLVLILLVLAMTEPRWLGTTQRQHILVAVDRSHSVGDAAVEVARKFAESANFDGADVGWMAFGASGRIYATLEELMEASTDAVGTDRTDFGTAASLAAASFLPGRVRTLVLVTDGNNTEQSVDEDMLREHDIRVHTLPAVPPVRPEVLVREVSVPAHVRANEPISVNAVIQASVETTAQVDLFLNGVRIATRSAALRQGENKIQFQDRAGEGKLLYYEVGIRPGTDTVSENNQAGAAAVSAGISQVLLVSDNPQAGRFLAWSLKQEGIPLSTRPAAGMPSTMSDLQNYDALIIDNVAASDLSREQMELARTYVRDFGGGFLMLGGDQAYGLGGYFRTPVEDVLPVRCDFQKEDETPSLALALVIDRSGSMSGEPLELAKAAAKASADLLTARDYISIIAFDNDTHPVVQLQAAGSGSLGSQIASITAEGGTNMAPAMEEALRQLLPSTAKLKHVILLTDGVSQEGPFYELAQQMVANNITVSTVAAGGGADRALLSQIAQWGGGRYYETNDVSSIPQIFTKETMTASKSAIQEFPFMAKPVRAVDFLEGVPWSEAPFLLGYVRTRSKPTAELWLLTERGDPLLATWRFGLGTAAAFTSDARNRWAVEWIRWSGFGKFWGQLLRKIGRPASLGLAEVDVRDTPEGAEFTVSALDPVEGFLGEVEVSAHIVSPLGESQEIALEKQMPGQWAASFVTPDRGVYSGQVVLKKKGEPVETRFFTVTRGFSPEYLLKEPDHSFLSALSSATGGVFSPDPATIFLNPDRSAAVEHELWPWLVLLASLVLVSDTGLRRWPENSRSQP